MKNQRKQWTKEFIQAELKWMDDKLITEEKAGKIKTMYKMQLCVERGYSAQTWAKRIKKYEHEDWFEEKWSLISDRLHIRLYSLAMQNPGRTTMAIWMDKVNFGMRETEVEEIKDVTINVRQVTL